MYGCRLSVSVTDEKDRPASSLVGVAVTDDTVLEMVERRRQPPRLPCMALFESDVDHLDDAHVYLDQANPIADQAVDLLLGTQGWRRFAFVNPVSYLEWLDEAGKGQEPPSLTDVRRGPHVRLTNAAEGIVTSENEDYTIFQATAPLRKTAPVHYYELTVKSLPVTELRTEHGVQREEGVVAIGFAHKYLEDRNQLPGWKTHTYAVHSDDGHWFDENRMVPYDWRFAVGDTVGLGFNGVTRQAFFTKNGRFVGVCGAVDLTVPLFATVGFHGKGVSVQVNWGQLGPFKFNLAARIEARPKAKHIVERLLASSAGVSVCFLFCFFLLSLNFFFSVSPSP